MATEHALLSHIKDIESQLTASNELIEKLYASGCLDYERECMVQAWLTPVLNELRRELHGFGFPALMK